MGSRKRLVLASLVSMMMALAFVIGWLPSHTTLGANAASGSNGRITMADLLDGVLGLKQGDPAVAISVASPENGAIIKVPTDAIAAPLFLRAIAIGDAADVVYGIDPAVDYEWAGGENWVGQWIAGPSSIRPYKASFDLVDLFTGTLGVGAAYNIYSFANATVLENVAGAEVQYALRNDGPNDDVVDPNFTQFTLIEEEAAVDDNDNGIPENVFEVVQDGETWLVTYEVPLYDQNGNQVGTVLRQVAVTSLGSVEKQFPLGVAVSPAPNVTITAPSLAELQAGGVATDAEAGVLIASVSSDVSGVVDLVDGLSTPEALGAWGAEVAAKEPPAGPVLSSDEPVYVEASILVTANAGANYAEVEELPEGSTVDLEIRGLDIPTEGDVTLWSYPTRIVAVDSDFVVANLEDETDVNWSLQAVRDPEAAGQGTDEFVASVTSLSIFSVFKSAWSIYSIYPDSGPVGVAIPDVKIEGEFGFETPQTLEQLDAALAVYFGDARAEITSGLDLAKAASSFYVTVPAAASAGPVDVTVVDLENPSNLATKASGFTYLTSYTLTVNTSGSGSGTVTPPSGTVYLDGEVALLTATPSEGSVFVRWEGDLTGSVNPATLTMDSDKVVTAVFDAIGAFTLTTSSSPAEGGVVNRAPDQDTYAPDTEVTLTAVPNPGYFFTGWSGDLSGSVNPTTITMDGDKDVVALFQTIPQYTLTVLPSDGGSVQPDPSGLYLAGTVVGLTAVPNADFEFVRWEGDVDLGASVNPNSITMDANKTVRAIFRSTVIQVNEIEPSNAWLFGGVTAKVSGQGFVADVTKILIEGEEAEVLAVSDDGQDIYIIVPALVNTSPADQQLFVVDVVGTNEVGNPGQTDTLADGFTYKRYEVQGDVSMTAFYFDTNESGLTPIDLAIQNVLGMAKLYLPAPSAAKCNVPSAGYGIARISKNTGALGTNFIDAGTTIPNIWDLAIHLYNNTYPLGSSFNTAPLGLAVYPEIKGWSYERSADSQDDELQRAALEFPVDDTALTAAMARAGLSLWSIDSDYNYGTGVTTAALGSTAYQSTLLGNEIDPVVTNTTPNATELDSVIARVYDLSAFSLRSGAIQLPATIKQGVQLGTPDGTGRGPVAGGTAVTINAPNGGFAWTTIAFGEFPVDAGGNPLPANAASYPNVLPDNLGASEYEIDLHSPAWSDQGITEDIIVDIAIYLNSDLTRPAVVLKDVYRYEAKTVINPLPWLLLLLGLGAALIGLAAGGDSGDSGGPCFIATAAYGTPLAADIDTLRSFRDTYMLSNPVGTAAVDAYYHVSPAIADAVAKSPALAAVVRIALVPVILAAKLALTMPGATLMALLASMMAARIWRRKRTRA